MTLSVSAVLPPLGQGETPTQSAHAHVHSPFHAVASPSATAVAAASAAASSRPSSHSPTHPHGAIQRTRSSHSKVQHATQQQPPQLQESEMGQGGRGKEDGYRAEAEGSRERERERREERVAVNTALNVTESPVLAAQTSRSPSLLPSLSLSHPSSSSPAASDPRSTRTKERQQVVTTPGANSSSPLTSSSSSHISLPITSTASSASSSSAAPVLSNRGSPLLTPLTPVASTPSSGSSVPVSLPGAAASPSPVSPLPVRSSSTLSKFNGVSAPASKYGYLVISNSVLDGKETPEQEKERLRKERDAAQATAAAAALAAAMAAKEKEKEQLRGSKDKDGGGIASTGKGNRNSHLPASRSRPTTTTSSSSSSAGAAPVSELASSSSEAGKPVAAGRGNLMPPTGMKERKVGAVLGAGGVTDGVGNEGPPLFPPLPRISTKSRPTTGGRRPTTGTATGDNHFHSSNQLNESFVDEFNDPAQGGDGKEAAKDRVKEKEKEKERERTEEERRRKDEERKERIRKRKEDKERLLREEREKKRKGEAALNSVTGPIESDDIEKNRKAALITATKVAASPSSSSSSPSLPTAAAGGISEEKADGERKKEDKMVDAEAMQMQMQMAMANSPASSLERQLRGEKGMASMTISPSVNVNGNLTGKVKRVSVGSGRERPRTGKDADNVAVRGKKKASFSARGSRRGSKSQSTAQTPLSQFSSAATTRADSEDEDNVQDQEQFTPADGEEAADKEDEGGDAATSTASASRTKPEKNRRSISSTSLQARQQAEDNDADQQQSSSSSDESEDEAEFAARRQRVEQMHEHELASMLQQPHQTAKRTQKHTDKEKAQTTSPTTLSRTTTQHSAMGGASSGTASRSSRLRVSVVGSGMHEAPGIATPSERRGARKDKEQQQFATALHSPSNEKKDRDKERKRTDKRQQQHIPPTGISGKAASPTGSNSHRILPNSVPLPTITVNISTATSSNSPVAGESANAANSGAALLPLASASPLPASALPDMPGEQDDDDAAPFVYKTFKWKKKQAPADSSIGSSKIMTSGQQQQQQQQVSKAATSAEIQPGSGSGKARKDKARLNKADPPSAGAAMAVSSGRRTGSTEESGAQRPRSLSTSTTDGPSSPTVPSTSSSLTSSLERNALGLSPGMGIAGVGVAPGMPRASGARLISEMDQVYKKQLKFASSSAAAVHTVESPFPLPAAVTAALSSRPGSRAPSRPSSRPQSRAAVVAAAAAAGELGTPSKIFVTTTQPITTTPALPPGKKLHRIVSTFKVQELDTEAAEILQPIDVQSSPLTLSIDKEDSSNTLTHNGAASTSALASPAHEDKSKRKQSAKRMKKKKKKHEVTAVLPEKGKGRERDRESVRKREEQDVGADESEGKKKAKKATAHLMSAELRFEVVENEFECEEVTETALSSIEKPLTSTIPQSATVLSSYLQTLSLLQQQPHNTTWTPPPPPPLNVHTPLPLPAETEGEEGAAALEYEPSDEAILSYAAVLGLELPADRDLLWIPRLALMEPLPPPWRACVSGDVIYFVNFSSGECTFTDPSDEFYASLYREEREKRWVDRVENEMEQSRVRHTAVLRLGGKQIDDVAAEVVADMILGMAEMEGPDITHTHQQQQGYQQQQQQQGAQIMAGWNVGMVLSHLDLSHNLIGAAGASTLLSALCLSPHAPLHTLDLSSNQLPIQAMTSLAAYLRHNPFLRHLSLNNNEGIGNMGMEILANSLSTCSSLRSLRLLRVGINEFGAGYICAGLAGHYSLQMLDLRENDIGDTGLKAIGRLLLQCRTLTEVRLNGLAEMASTASSTPQLSPQTSSNNLHSVATLPFARRSMVTHHPHSSMAYQNATLLEQELLVCMENNADWMASHRGPRIALILGIFASGTQSPLHVLNARHRRQLFNNNATGLRMGSVGEARCDALARNTIIRIFSFL